MKDVFNHSDTNEFIRRINNLESSTVPQWGKMDVARMLAHCNVKYEKVFDDSYPKTHPIKKFFLRLIVKNTVVNEKPYKRNSPTAPEFIIKDDKNFDYEKERLIIYIKKVQQLGAEYFDNKPYVSFGPLTQKEWNNMFSKHLDHHLTQFGV